jgi:hypothetical protein
VAVDGAGNILITGDFEGDIDLGGGSMAAAGDYDVFLAQLSPSGAHNWSQRYGDELEDYVKGIAVDDSANVIVTGFFFGDIDFGGGTISSLGSNDIFVGKLDSNGAHIWSQGFGDDHSVPIPNISRQFAEDVAVDRAGSIVLSGYFYGTVDFGGGTLTSGTSRWDNTDMFIAKFGQPSSELTRDP